MQEVRSVQGSARLEHRSGRRKGDIVIIKVRRSYRVAQPAQPDPVQGVGDVRDEAPGGVGVCAEAGEPQRAVRVSGPVDVVAQLRDGHVRFRAFRVRLAADLPVRHQHTVTCAAEEMSRRPARQVLAPFSREAEDARVGGGAQDAVLEPVGVKPGGRDAHPGGVRDAAVLDGRHERRRAAVRAHGVLGVAGVPRFRAVLVRCTDQAVALGREQRVGMYTRIPQRAAHRLARAVVRAE